MPEKNEGFDTIKELVEYCKEKLDVIDIKELKNIHQKLRLIYKIINIAIKLFPIETTKTKSELETTMVPILLNSLLKNKPDVQPPDLIRKFMEAIQPKK